MSSSFPGCQDDKQADCGECAAPKRDLKALGMLELSGDRTGNAPAEGGADHEGRGKKGMGFQGVVRPVGIEGASGARKQAGFSCGFFNSSGDVPTHQVA